MNTLLIQKTKKLLLKRFNVLPQIAIITGSGIKIFRNKEPLFSVKYAKLPIWSKNTTKHKAGNIKQRIKGHEGILKLYKIKNKNILVFSGRHHLYEGLSIVDVISNIRLAYELGVKKIIMTNAAGGIEKTFKVGDLMLIKGFIDLMQPTERGILSGVTQPIYKIKTKLTNLIMKAGLINPAFINPAFRKGVYAGMLGPSYETHSEIKLLQSLGADAVGMSTVPEIICAKSLKLDFAAISIISNVWNTKHKPSHKEVLKNVNKANKRLDDLILKIIDN